MIHESQIAQGSGNGTEVLFYELTGKLTPTYWLVRESEVIGRAKPPGAAGSGGSVRRSSGQAAGCVGSMVTW